MSAILGDSEALRVNADRFRDAHGAEWERLDDLCRRLERKGARALDADELLALPGLYRSTLSSLSVARNFSLDVALTGWLEQLCARAYFQLYGVPVSLREQIARFFLHDWPAAVRTLWRELAFCLLLTALSAVAGYWLVALDPSWYYALIPAGMSEGRDPGASAEALRATLYGHHSESPLSLLATFLFTHNAQVALMAFALGFAFAIPTVLLIAEQGLLLGAMLAVFVSRGLGPDFVAWLTIHGTTELLAINIAGAAGIGIGLAAAFPGRETRMEAIRSSGRRAAAAMIGVVVMLSVAGMLEGIGRQIVQDMAMRATIGIAMLAGWAVYFSGTARLPGRAY